MNTDEKNARQGKMPKNVVSKFYRLTMSVKGNMGVDNIMYLLLGCGVRGCGVASK